MTAIQQKMDMFKEKKSPSEQPRNKETVSKKSLYRPQIISQGNISVSAFCSQLFKKNIRIGRNQMFKWLRKNGYISKQKSTWNMPLPKYTAQGIFEVKETFVLVADEQVAKYSPLITPRGKAHLTEKLKESFVNGGGNKSARSI